MALTPRPSNVDRALLQAPEDVFSEAENELANQEDAFFNVEVLPEDDGGAEVLFGPDDEAPLSLPIFTTTLPT